ncbi:glycoside hydrolase family 65 protein [Spiroplasma floricola]|uniref:Alpha,alpha-trehalose phosphorylase n=1 Tax=Spiroplasma floricola 23-6 TaxID=1336749 RepID=A0A2K8SEP1_9MOLU|nr:glycoside hydrolase family 65 protein [Spiroplasma floricola]AUB31916.1 alpha,alpha-trehalose phosphorylase [Spiroplasma floricola 23-6]
MSLLIKKSEFIARERQVEESVFSISNGYLGMRASFEEGSISSISSIEGTYINAFYDLFDIQYAAKYTGYPDVYQRMVPIVNAQNIEIFVNNERYLFDESKVQDYKLEFDMSTGEIRRCYKVLINSENYLELSFKKLLSQKNFDLFLQNINIRTNFKVQTELKLKFPLIFKEQDTDKGIPNDPRSLLKGQESFTTIEKSFNKNHQSIIYQTLKSKLNYIYSTKIKGLENFELNHDEEGLIFTKSVLQEDVNIYKISSIYESRLKEVSVKIAQESVETYSKKNYLEHLQEHILFFKNFWKKAYADFGNNNKQIETANNYNMFQLWTNVGKLAWTNIAAKGLSGEGYGGHYFWDSEIYIITALTLFDSKLAKLMLMFRYNTLDKARQRARVLNHPKGALYPWRTINGEETSTYYPAGTAQYHINGDISFTVMNYFNATKDYEFIYNYGLDILVETSRLWEDKIVVTNEKGHINTITGPDEYQILVNDDYWTNCVAKYNLQSAVEILNLLEKTNKNLYDKKVEQLKIDKQEIKDWDYLSKILVIPYNNKLDLNPQHDNFLKRKPISKEEIEKYKPLLRTLHPLSINTLRVTKQADVVLANLFFFDKEKKSTMINNWKFYDETDTADSSLSKCIYAIMAARLEIGDFGFDYFKESINLDILDIHKNTSRGLHMANMGGARMFIIYGLLGLNIHKNNIAINPRYNEIISEFKINIEYLQEDISFCLKNKKLVIEKSKSDQAIEIICYDKKYSLTEKLEIEL